MNGWAWCRGFDRRSSIVCACWTMVRILKSSCGVCVEIDVLFLMLGLDSVSDGSRGLGGLGSVGGGMGCATG